MQETKQIRLLPKLGKLYKFRTDNTKDVLNTYGYYLTGLVMCIEEDMLKYLKEEKTSLLVSDYYRNNIIYRFEMYNCKRYYNDQHIYSNGEFSEVKGDFYLSISEVQDMLEDA